MSLLRARSELDSAPSLELAQNLADAGDAAQKWIRLVRHPETENLSPERPRPDDDAMALSAFLDCAFSSLL